VLHTAVILQATLTATLTELPIEQRDPSEEQAIVQQV
jgi:hypothetical protein